MKGLDTGAPDLDACSPEAQLSSTEINPWPLWFQWYRLSCGLSLERDPVCRSWPESEGRFCLEGAD